MTTVQQIENMIKRHPRLYDEYSYLKRLGWRLKRKNILLSNADIDAENKILFIDDDEEGPTRIVQWVKEAVKLAYQKNDDLRRRAIRDYAIRRFRQRNGETDISAMAKVYAWSAWYFINSYFNVYRWMDDLTLILAGRTPSLAGRNSTYYIFKGGLRANSTGFKREFRDSSNQVRHTTFSIQASLKYGIIGWTIAQLREIGGGGDADIRLNNACLSIANQLKNLQFIIHNRRRSEQALMNSIRRLILSRLGDPKERKPWNGPPGGLPEY